MKTRVILAALFLSQATAYAGSYSVASNEGPFFDRSACHSSIKELEKLHAWETPEGRAIAEIRMNFDDVVIFGRHLNGNHKDMMKIAAESAPALQEIKNNAGHSWAQVELNEAKAEVEEWLPTFRENFTRHNEAVSKTAALIKARPELIKGSQECLEELRNQRRKVYDARDAFMRKLQGDRLLTSMPVNSQASEELPSGGAASAD